jgi:hypothetical protein
MASKSDKPTDDEMRHGLENGEKWRQEGRDQYQRTEDLVDSLRLSLSDSDLRNILVRRPEERDEYGRIDDPDLIFAFVPREYQGQAVENDEAKNILDCAVEHAIRLRLKDTEGFVFT